MTGVVSGFVPRMLVDPDVRLFRAHERAFTAMLDDLRTPMRFPLGPWRTQELGRPARERSADNQHG
ncbi:hypothetical protein SB659_17245 [Arthrobacter sp. SIMBA_036]|uniref:hypothetical protein n=1 Tax=Arthrobacter sp. SIMBA_036 TaxID=3085778 RepID=UPI00397D6F8D